MDFSNFNHFVWSTLIFSKFRAVLHWMLHGMAHATQALNAKIKEAPKAATVRRGKLTFSLSLLAVYLPVCTDLTIKKQSSTLQWKRI